MKRDSRPILDAATYSDKSWACLMVNSDIIYVYVKNSRTNKYNFVCVVHVFQIGQAARMTIFRAEFSADTK